MQKITPFLWFDDKAEEAANYYVSVFRNSKIRSVARYGEAGAEVSGRPEGTVMTVAFELDGQEFIALNGGPQFKFSEAISFVVKCAPRPSEIFVKKGGGARVEEVGRDQHSADLTGVAYAVNS